MTDQEIIDYVKYHSSGKVKIAFTDMDGVLRGKYISVDKFLTAIESTTNFCDVIFGWDMSDVTTTANLPDGTLVIRTHLPEST